MSSIDSLPPLRDVIASHDLATKKSLGQNFILDLNLTAKIARLAGDLTKADVLEIGPGPGGLTRGLLAEGARRVLAIEKDPRCMPALAEIEAAYPGQLHTIIGDALLVNPLKHLTQPIKIGDVVVIEGILLLAFPEIVERLDLRVYRDCPENVRFARRLRRDMAERGRTELSVYQQFEATVKPMHDDYVEPCRSTADIVTEFDEELHAAADRVITAVHAIQTSGF